MKKIDLKKTSLRKETLRALQGAKLEVVEGGAEPAPRAPERMPFEHGG